jgi:hypothetical protein
MCIDLIELFVRIFLISPHLKIHVCWKDVLHQPENTVLTIQKIISCIWPNIPITDSTTENKRYPKDAAVRTIRYSWHLSTVGTALLFTESINSTNITELFFERYTVSNQDTLQHFPSGSTSTPRSHTRLHLTKGLVWLKCRPSVNALIHFYVYRMSTIWILVSDARGTGVHIYLFIII